MTDQSSSIALVIEVWGTAPDDIQVVPYADRASAEVDWEKRIRAYLDGSDRDIEIELSAAREDDCTFTHGEGCICLRRVEPGVTGMPADQPLRAALPTPLVDAIRNHLAHRPQDAEAFLGWSANSAVGVACRRLADLGAGLAGACDGAVDLSPVWSIVAHQCCICAFG